MRLRGSFIQRLFLMVDITLVNITAVNLNLFVVFEALVAERNVTRAAKRLGVTQSAVSNALRQLRTLFDDPLFLRRSAGVEPTPRALALVEPVRRGLAALGDALAPPRFDAATAERRFVIATSDYVELVLLPPLLARLGKEAPGIRLEVVPWGQHEVPDMLSRAEADLMIGYYARIPPAHREQSLFTEEFMCLARKKHPVIGKTLTLKGWTSVPHVVVSQKPGSTSSVDRALAKRGLSRIVGVRVSHFMIVPEIVARTDFVAALSRRIAEPAARAHDLRLFAPPLPLGKSTVGQVWHDRLDADPGHRWLRSVISEVASGV
jgi:DNA-binding transcriptional LysR family regulator